MKFDFESLTEDMRYKLMLATVLPRPDEVHRPVARGVLDKLQGLHRLAREATPVQLVAFAIERLNLRVVMAARHGRRNARACQSRSRYRTRQAL